MPPSETTDAQFVDYDADARAEDIERIPGITSAAVENLDASRSTAIGDGDTEFYLFTISIEGTAQGLQALETIRHALDRLVPDDAPQIDFAVDVIDGILYFQFLIRDSDALRFTQAALGIPSEIRLGQEYELPNGDRCCAINAPPEPDDAFAWLLCPPPSDNPGAQYMVTAGGALFHEIGSIADLKEIEPEGAAPAEA